MPIATITSLTNPLIMQAVKLHERKGRDNARLFIAEGVRICTTLLQSMVVLDRLYVIKDYVKQAQQLCKDEQIFEVTLRVMEKISASHSPSGMVGIFHIPQQQQLSLVLRSGVVLAQIADPGNMGSLIRTAAALRLDGVVIVEGADPWSPKVVQATAGTIGCIPLYRWSWDELCAYRGKTTLSALVVADGLSIGSIDAHQPRLFVVGNEAHGLPKEWQAACDELVTLPMPGDIESLNAAVAGSIALYVAYLQRKS